MFVLFSFNTDVCHLQSQCLPGASTLTQSTFIRARLDESDNQDEKSTQELKGAGHFWAQCAYT